MDLPIPFRVANVNTSNSGSQVAPSGPDGPDDRSASVASITSFDSHRENSYRESENTLKRIADANSDGLLQGNDGAKKVKIDNDS